jgi:hypothetical protein
MCNDIHSKFHQDWSMYSNSDGGWGNMQTHRQHDDLISLLLLYQNKGSKLKVGQTYRCSKQNMFRGIIN